MKVLIYHETPEAIALRDKLKKDGHSAYLRNGQYFNPDQFDKRDVDLVISDDQAIRVAYAKVGVKADPLTASAKQPAPVEAPTTAPLPEAAPKTEAPKTTKK